MRHSRLIGELLLVMALCWAISSAGARSSAIPAPEFPEGLQWLNVSRPLTMGELRGRVVILDFWTYGCVNCLHVIEELRRLEERFGDRLVVIGVHTPKFDNEKNLETLRNIVVRYDRRHPVVNDPDWRLARMYGVVAWPTLALIDPDGMVVGRVMGEGHEERLAQVTGELLAGRGGVEELPPLPIALEKGRFGGALLAAPGKIAVSADGHRVAISDTLHHRVILARRDGGIVRVFGGPEAGFRDGSSAEARFDVPQGLVFLGDRILVADAGNHSIRLIEPGRDRVSTVAGTGHRGRMPAGEHDALGLALASPWDLAWDDPWLYIAMAGDHRIWRMRLEDGRMGPFAGSGREGIDTGALSGASFSQPSAMVLIGNELYVADPEASAIRRIDIGRQRVDNLVGKGLFVFGDRDGRFGEALLQHPSGIAALDPHRLVVADTYNHKMKLLDLKAGQVSTILGTGEPGGRLATPSQTLLNEPGGVAVLQRQVLVADTNNHRILVLDTGSGTVREWPLHLVPEGLDLP